MGSADAAPSTSALRDDGGAPNPNLNTRPPRVLSIQSHVVSGYVGNKAAVFPLQLLGFDVDPVLSVHFSNHTGFPGIAGTRMSGDELLELLGGLEKNELLEDYTHLLTGYIGSASMLEAVKKVVQRLRERNPDLTYVCDPVLGDDGRLYTPEGMVDLFRDVIVPIASVVTPNSFEAELLTGRDVRDDASALAACDALHDMGPHTVVITSMPAEDSSHLQLVASTRRPQRPGRHQRLKVTVKRLPAYFTGTGDLLAALLLAWLHREPDDLQLAVETAVSSLQAVLKLTAEAAGPLAGVKERTPAVCKARELRLIQAQRHLVAPEITVKAELLR